MLYSSQVDGTLGTAQVLFLLSGGFLKMVVPNNHWFSLLKNGAFWDVKWGYHHLRETPSSRHFSGVGVIPVRHPVFLLQQNLRWMKCVFLF